MTTGEEDGRLRQTKEAQQPQENHRDTPRVEKSNKPKKKCNDDQTTQKKHQHDDQTKLLVKDRHIKALFCRSNQDTKKIRQALARITIVMSDIPEEQQHVHDPSAVGTEDQDKDPSASFMLNESAIEAAAAAAVAAVGDVSLMLPVVIQIVGVVMHARCTVVYLMKLR
jgi:hypothetical protein